VILLALLITGTISTVASGRAISRTGRYKRFPLLGLAIMALGLVALSTIDAHTSTATIAALLAFFGLGFGDGLWRVLATTLRQKVTPNHLLGRVNSVHRMFGMGAIPLGAALGGLEAHAFGVRAPFVIAAAGFGLAAIFSRAVLAPLRGQQ